MPKPAGMQAVSLSLLLSLSLSYTRTHAHTHTHTDETVKAEQMKNEHSPADGPQTQAGTLDFVRPQGSTGNSG